MGIIQCDESCKYQADGYCTLDRCAAVSSLSSACPYFTEKSLDKGDSFGESADTY